MTPQAHGAHDKTAMRAAARSARRAITGDARSRAAERVARRVMELPEVAGARAVAIFGPTAEEIDVSVLEAALREQGVRIAYPRITGPRQLALHWVEDAGSCETGPLGILAPPADAPETPLDELDAMIVPGVAFDAACNRLGHGRGYYDALIEGLPVGLTTIAVAYDEQIVSEVPCEPHDRAVDIIVTPTAVYRREA